MFQEPVPSSAQGACPICRPAAGPSPLSVVYQDDRFVAFVDPLPIRTGHLRVVARAHFPHFNALPDALARDLLALAQRLGDVQRAALGVDRVGFLFPAGGDGSAHAAVHVVPLLSAGDVVARRPLGAAPVELPAAERAAMAALLRDRLAVAA